MFYAKNFMCMLSWYTSSHFVTIPLSKCALQPKIAKKVARTQR